jgi:heparan-alpha-glucosaminide N-acetyltransferase
MVSLQNEPIATHTALPVDSAQSPALPARLASLDACRGLVMLLMMAEVLRLKMVAQALPKSGEWKFLASLQTHVPWTGASLHDFIQPCFSFLVGVALPFSIASRTARGTSTTWMTWHALWRALVLVLLGIFLRSTSQNSTNWAFEDTLTQIGLGYGFLFVLGLRQPRDAWIALGVILAGYWAGFALWALPAPDFDYAKVGVTYGWLQANGLTGFAAHWQKNSNLAWAFDTWWMNLFPREKPFQFNAGGYATLSFIPTLGTMILGLIAGRVLRSTRQADARLRWFAGAGAVCLLAGLALHFLGLCPIVKRIWTPSWTLASGGACLWTIGLCHWALDDGGKRRWITPLVVIGANSIAAYLIVHLCQPFIAKSLLTHLGAGWFRSFGPAYQPLLHGAATLLVMWLLLFWMWRRKIFLKI